MDPFAQCTGRHGCVGAVWGASGYVCDRHAANPTAPPMKPTCECATPDVESLGLWGAQCRRCGSPIAGTLAAQGAP